MAALTQFLQTIPGAIILLVVGFVCLIKGADFFVDGASNVAKRFHVPTLIIGLTIVAMGTSLPETAVSISASIAGSNSLAISNVSGSNLFNLLVVVGLCAIMQKVEVDKDTIRRDIPYSLLAAVVLIVLGMVGTGEGMILGRLDGAILLALFAFFLFLMIRSALKSAADSKEMDDEEVTQSVVLSLVSIVGGAAAIAFGGDWAVDAASTIALKLGMTETMVGLTIVAVGTSLPELVTSMVAAKKGENDIAIGNAIGSCIFNVVLILGLSSTINPLAITNDTLIDMIVMTFSVVLLAIFTIKKPEIDKKKGIIFILIYVVYLTYIILRNMQVF